MYLFSSVGSCLFMFALFLQELLSFNNNNNLRGACSDEKCKELSDLSSLLFELFENGLSTQVNNSLIYVFSQVFNSLM